MELAISLLGSLACCGYSCRRSCDLPLSRLFEKKHAASLLTALRAYSSKRHSFQQHSLRNPSELAQKSCEAELVKSIRAPRHFEKRIVRGRRKGDRDRALESSARCSNVLFSFTRLVACWMLRAPGPCHFILSYSTRRHQTYHFRKRATSASAEGPAYRLDFARHSEFPLRTLQPQKWRVYRTRCLQNCQ